MKSFFEGNGFHYQPKNENPYTIFQGACVYIASNKLPKLAYIDDPMNFNWGAFKVRVTFYKALAKHIKEDTGDFPLTAPMLAHIF